MLPTSTCAGQAGPEVQMTVSAGAVKGLTWFEHCEATRGRFCSPISLQQGQELRTGALGGAQAPGRPFEVPRLSTPAF